MTTTDDDPKGHWVEMPYGSESLVKAAVEWALMDVHAISVDHEGNRCCHSSSDAERLSKHLLTVVQLEARVFLREKGIEGVGFYALGSRRWVEDSEDE